MSSANKVLIFTGHLVDAAERASERLTSDMIERANFLISNAIDELLRIQKVHYAVSSLGAGGDILFASEILKRGIPLHIFLPFEKEIFIQESVNYLKQNPNGEEDTWREKFNSIVSQATSVNVIAPAANKNPFEACNEAILNFSFQLGESIHNIAGIALVRPGEERLVGGATDFVERLKEQNIPVQILWPYEKPNTSEVDKLELFIPVFQFLDHQSLFFQNRWRHRLKLSLIILASIALFDSFVTVPDHFLMGNGKMLRIVALITSVVGAFITLQLQLSDKTSLSQWTKSRAKAEQIRSELWFYLFNFWSENNRFSLYTEGELEVYIKRLATNEWKGEVVQLPKLIQLKQWVQQQSIPERTQFYLSHRIDDQLHYFEKKQNHFTNRLRKYKHFTFILLTLSITWGILKMAGEFYPAFVFFAEYSPLGMIISIIALVSSYSEANNSKEMEYKYFQMAEGLRDLRERHLKINSRASFDDWVKECETFLRTQNNEWSLKRENR